MSISTEIDTVITDVLSGDSLTGMVWGPAFAAIDADSLGAARIVAGLESSNFANHWYGLRILTGRHNPVGTCPTSPVWERASTMARNIMRHRRWESISPDAKARVEWVMEVRESGATTGVVEVDVDAYLEAMNDADAVIYAWKWENEDVVKIGKTTKGSARWTDPRPTDVSPDSWAKLVAERGERIHIGYVRVAPEHLADAEKFAHRLMATNRIGTSEFFAIDIDVAKATMDAVRAKFRSGGVA